tara:strand:+ start:51 stop:251 length:201 start_codon:yes stop_codon:yes gene_type:complete
MSSITLKFKIPEEREEAESAMRGVDYLSALHDVENYCRNAIKHDEGCSEQCEVYLEKVRDLIREVD